MLIPIALRTAKTSYRVLAVLSAIGLRCRGLAVLIAI